MSLIDLYTQIIKFQIAKVNKPSTNLTNCPNCGAVVTSNRCEYCGTVFCKGDMP